MKKCAAGPARSGSAARSRWQEGGGKAASVAATAAAVLQQRRQQAQAQAQAHLSDVPESQVRRARGAYAGLFLLLVTVWSAILISAIFSLRINREACENCPVGCRCKETPPAWG